MAGGILRETTGPVRAVKPGMGSSRSPVEVTGEGQNYHHIGHRRGYLIR
jgi:hypothetical protein